MVMKILGIDETGRGSILGPLVICGFLIEEEKIELLKKMGVKDSKLLSPKKRSFLYQKLKKIADDIEIIELSAADIDQMRTESNLNRIEIEHMQQIVNKLNPDKIFVDSVEANTEKFCKKILAGLDKPDKYGFGTTFICENFADKKYPIVGAASIMAKVVRDTEIEKLHEKHGFFGSGYTSDSRTIEFIKNWLEEKGSLPSFARSSWVTAKILKSSHDQKKLGDYM